MVCSINDGECVQLTTVGVSFTKLLFLVEVLGSKSFHVPNLARKLNASRHIKRGRLNSCVIYRLYAAIYHSIGSGFALTP